MKINDKPILRVRRVTWNPGDARELRAAVIIGRCHVELADGSFVTAPLAASTHERNLGDRFAVIFDEVTSTFVAIPVDVPEAV